MASEIKLPELGENLTGGQVVDVKVAPGDVVNQGQTLLEVEAEKSTVEVPSPIGGRVRQMLVKKGEAIQVGQSLCIIEEGGESGGDGAKTGAARKEVSAAPEQKAKKEAAAQAPSTKAKEVTAAPEQKAKKEAAAQAPSTKAKEPRTPSGNGREEAAPPIEAKPVSNKVVPAGPSTRRLARELGVDLAQVRGSAAGGRVTQEDVKAFVRGLATGTAAAGRGIPLPPLPDFERWGAVERRPLDGVRRKTAEHVSLAWSVIPHVTQHDQADITELEAFRKQQDGKGPKLTVTAFALKAAAIALREFPQVNSSLDFAAGQLIVKKYYHLGVAVDTERGLLVPVLRDVDHKSVQVLAQELTDVAERARQKKLQIEDLRGGTFTITNLGGIGGTGFTPIVNYPEVAILGLSRSRLMPVVREGQVVPRLLLPLSLSYDHRVIDGAGAARFARRLAELLENPLVMLLHA